MTDANSIPINIARALLPGRRDYISLSHIYTPSRPDAETDTTVTYKIPYAKGVTWTHICPHWTGAQEPYYHLFYVSPTADPLTVPFPAAIANGYYQPFEWPIPPAPLGEAHFKLVAFKPARSTPEETLRIKILGFEDILPENASEYIYEDKYHPLPSQSQWSFRLNPTTNLYKFLYPLERAQHPHHPSHPLVIPTASDLILAGIP